MIMKKYIIALCALLISFGAFAQNEKADNIIGTYLAGSGKDAYKVRITRQSDGSYMGTICWLADPYDADGKLSVDKKNPNKELRNTPMDKVVLFSGLKYNDKQQQWGDAKIYDPNRGISVKMTAKFEGAKNLVVRGTVLGIGESVKWVKQD